MESPNTPLEDLVTHLQRPSGELSAVGPRECKVQPLLRDFWLGTGAKLGHDGTKGEKYHLHVGFDACNRCYAAFCSG